MQSSIRERVKPVGLHLYHVNIFNNLILRQPFIDTSSGPLLVFTPPASIYQKYRKKALRYRVFGTKRHNKTSALFLCP